MFGNNLSLQQAAQGAEATFRRFPLTLLSALIGTAVCYQLVELADSGGEAHQYWWKLLWFAWLGLILFFDLEIITERYGLDPKKSGIVFLTGLAALIGYYFLLPAVLAERQYIQLFLFSLSLHLLASVAAYLNPRTENGFWQFNEKLFIRFLTATLYTSVLYLGLCIAILAITKLFQVNLGDKVYVWLFLFLAGVFHPWFFLAGVPRNLQALEPEITYPKGLKVFTQFVLLPLVSVYLLILYGYLLKIIFLWNWPRGWVSSLVLSFSVVGIFSLLLIYPLRNTEGNTWIRTYARWFYRALFPLLLLFALAIWRRVSDYGITEERYFVILLAAWLLIVAVYFLLSRSKNIKFIPLTLCLLAFFSAFGPWGAFSVSERSQTNRLKYYFQKNAMLSGGKLRPAPKKVTLEDAREISSILEYLDEKHDLQSIRPWFNPKIDSIYAQYYPDRRYEHSQVDDLIRALQLERSLYYFPEDSTTVVSQAENSPPVPILKEFKFYGSEYAPVRTSGFDYLVSLRFYANGDNRQAFNLGTHRLEISSQPDPNEITPRLQFKWNQQDSSSLDLRPILRNLLKENATQPADQLLTAEANIGKVRLSLYFKTTKGILRDNKPELSELEFRVLVELPEGSISELRHNQ
ncbi:DUF4153 domain-containing protein [Adhaeribacter soli]|uniref:DUF4153 domain-containing protein n=1 Tax=Adhaeribacter soli TaxID=2607655 RepID=A0A5N1ILT1_9BACT|nr:DUF4153 domain-containing protein [Adhaeribacter soli]KAA9327308.1 DUF4153 domain-containing protein [Adhaeribacter soli]